MIDDPIRANEKIRTFIEEEIDAVVDGESLEALDSMDVLRVVMYIEEEFAVEVSADDLIPEHFSSIGAVADLVTRKSRIIES